MQVHIERVDKIRFWEEARTDYMHDRVLNATRN
jgi:hypothetical protein